MEAAGEHAVIASTPTDAAAVPFERHLVHSAQIGELRLPSWLKLAAGVPTNVGLERAGLAGRDSHGDWHPTAAGLLMASDQPQEHRGAAFFQAVAYRVTRPVSPGGGIPLLATEDITGPLDRQIDVACDFVRRHMRVSAHRDSDGRNLDLRHVPRGAGAAITPAGSAAGLSAYCRYAMRAVFEAVTNAVAHRDYTMRGSRIRLRLFDDRLELFVPGALVGTMTPDSLAFRQSSRNSVLISALARCPVLGDDAGPRQTIMDKRGEGVSIILDESEALSGRRPEYRLLDQSELLLTIYAARLEDPT